MAAFIDKIHSSFFSSQPVDLDSQFVKLIENCTAFARDFEEASRSGTQRVQELRTFLSSHPTFSVDREIFFPYSSKECPLIRVVRTLPLISGMKWDPACDVILVLLENAKDLKCRSWNGYTPLLYLVDRVATLGVRLMREDSIQEKFATLCEEFRKYGAVLDENDLDLLIGCSGDWLMEGPVFAIETLKKALKIGVVSEKARPKWESYIQKLSEKAKSDEARHEEEMEARRKVLLEEEKKLEKMSTEASEALIQTLRLRRAPKE